MSYRLSSLKDREAVKAAVLLDQVKGVKRVLLFVHHPEGTRMRTVRVFGKDHRDFRADEDVISLDPKLGAASVEVEY